MSGPEIMAVMRMHRAPRFGHSSKIALLASPIDHERNDYMRGLLAFSIFLIALIVLWIIILVLIKMSPVQKVGCAKGGVIDVAKLRESQEPRPSSRKLIIRAWRIQSAFMLCSVLIPVLTALYLHYGLLQYEDALVEVSETASQVRELALEADDITNILIDANNRLNETTLLEYLDIKSYCPNTRGSSIVKDMGLTEKGRDIQSMLDQFNEFIETHVDAAQQVASTVHNAANSVDGYVEFVFANDWKPKMFLLVLNVLNFFLLGGVCLSRHNIVHRPYHCITSYVFIPAFVGMLLVFVMATCGFAITAIMSADICSGGQGSAEGTLEDVFDIRGINETQFAYQLLRYYQQDCATDNPVEIYAPSEDELLHAIDMTHSFLSILDSHELELLNEECGADMTPLMKATRYGLQQSLASFVAQLRRMLILTSCYKINPVRRKAFDGAPCNSGASAMTWMFSTVLALSIVAMVMVSTRSALYNAVVRPPRDGHTLQEWDEYKEYMKRFYDTREWRMIPSPGKKRQFGGLRATGSFETEVTTKPSASSTDSSSPGTSSVYTDEENQEALSTTTPMRSRRGTKRFLESGQSRSPLEALDEEMLPLSPTFPTPRAPKKAVAKLRRTRSKYRLD